jgi:hypothetical protein
MPMLAVLRLLPNTDDLDITDLIRFIQVIRVWKDVVVTLFMSHQSVEPPLTRVCGAVLGWLCITIIKINLSRQNLDNQQTSWYNRLIMTNTTVPKSSDK